MNKIKTKIIDFINKNIGLMFPKPEDEHFLDKQYTVIPGTIRRKPDYDDAWLFALSRKAQNILDIGCNIGQATMNMLHENNNLEEIILVDPNPNALMQAAYNLFLNHEMVKARFLCSFVADKQDKKIKFYTIGKGAAGSMYPGHAKSAAKRDSHYLVPTTTIDAISKKFDFIPDLIKIDTEGAEASVLMGAKETARQQRAKIFVEMHSQPELPMNKNAELIIDWCQKYNYKAWYLKDKNLLQSPGQIANRGRCHLLLLPEFIPFPDYLSPISQGSKIEEVNFIQEQQ